MIDSVNKETIPPVVRDCGEQMTEVFDQILEGLGYSLLTAACGHGELPAQGEQELPQVTGLGRVAHVAEQDHVLVCHQRRHLGEREVIVNIKA